ncbi:MAG: hypothetical protein C5B59_08630 [Bacteroidetes bacterium]|nr:MAG: hypothetical protein C5B59_08630 [Bacteroidota bacterium]
MSKEAMRLWRKNNPEAAKAAGREAARLFRQRHPEYCMEVRNSLRGRWNFFKSKAKKRGIALELSYEEWIAIVNGAPCHYCGHEITSKGSSLDRKNSSLGYTKDNVVPCCVPCNRIRNEDIVSYEEMLYIMPLLLEFRKRSPNES